MTLPDDDKEVTPQKTLEVEPIPGQITLEETLAESQGAGPEASSSTEGMES